MTADPHLATATRSIDRPILTALLAWASMIGVDLFLHAGILAPLYGWDSPFLLPAVEAFVRIPAGYLAFMILAAALVWLLPRLAARNGRDGAAVGGVAGGVVWGALLLGLWSISTADVKLLVAWWIGQTMELALAGYVVGMVIGGARLRSVARLVGAILVVGVATAIALQSIGYATAPVVIGS